MIYKYSIGANVRTRLVATAEFSQAIINCEKEDSRLKDELVSATKELWPAIKKVVKESSLLDSLFTYGRWNEKIPYEINDYGFGDLGDIENQFRKLKSVWKQSINVRFVKESHRVSVTVSYVVW